MKLQNKVCLQIPIESGQESALAKVLSASGNPASAQSAFPFQKFEEIHFARWFIVPGTILNGKKIPASVMYAANIDGSASRHLKALSEKAAAALDDIFAHCQDYLKQEDRTPGGRLAYLNAHFLRTQAFYVGAPKRSVEQIREEAKLHGAVREIVKQEKGAAGKSPQATLDHIRRQLAADDRWDRMSKQPFKLPGIQWIRAFFFLIAVLLSLIPAIIAIELIHFFYEKRLPPLGLDINQLDAKRLESLKMQEDIVYQNQLTQVFEIKPGLRKIFLHYILWFTNQLANIVAVKGDLLGTPTIHFARWVLIDQGRRYIFLSNFDGSYDEYLGDFIDNGGWGLNAVYSNARGYPRTRYVFLGGAYKIGEFLAWGRFYQVPTQTWYTAYPQFGLPQIINRSKLRVGLFSRKSLNSEQVEDTLRRI